MLDMAPPELSGRIRGSELSNNSTNTAVTCPKVLFLSVELVDSVKRHEVTIKKKLSH
jgi:hypothetical protein